MRKDAVLAVLEADSERLASAGRSGRDRAEEARILDEMGWTYLRHQDPAQARRSFLDAVRAHPSSAGPRDGAQASGTEWPSVPNRCRTWATIARFLLRS
jgi:hypothetical protein